MIWSPQFPGPALQFKEAELAAVLAPLVGRLREGGVLVVERSTRSPEPGWPAGLRRFEQKRHGETTVWFAETDVTSPASPGAPD